jgi:hypothetical protein
MFAERDFHRIRLAMPQYGRIHEVIVKDRIGSREQLDRSQRNEPRIARSGADEIDFTVWHRYGLLYDIPRHLLTSPAE